MAMKIKSMLGVMVALISLTACDKRREPTPETSGNSNDTMLTLPTDVADTIPERLFAIVPRDIPVKSYFKYLKETAAAFDTLVPYPLSEHLLVRANPWIIDTLENTDYYRRKLRGETLYRQPNEVVLHQGDTLFFPDSLSAGALLDAMKNTLIDVNIPEYRLRIIEYGKTLHSFPIRVGKNRIRHLKLAGHDVDLRTKPGKGAVVRLNQYPIFLDPVSGKKFTHTKRDDKITTLMPQIPWVEVELDGQRYGQMIHPTTNPETLEKAYSNGCVGLKEADAWRFYYHAPLGTAVVFRYDLEVIGVSGDTILLPDIYKWGKKTTRLRAVFRALP
ncbi:MAG: L,D-transpeptidase [Saprospiraceae bacterium]|nr:L,D-transpeptidase [Saprospiraceae bacterium]